MFYHVKGIFWHLGKYTYSLSSQELDESIGTILRYESGINPPHLNIVKKANKSISQLVELTLKRENPNACDKPQMQNTFLNVINSN